MSLTKEQEIQLRHIIDEGFNKVSLDDVDPEIASDKLFDALQPYLCFPAQEEGIPCANMRDLDKIMRG